jgi:K+-transporting ATPase ATPase C chain
MRTVLRPALVVFTALTVLTGLAYPLALTALAALAAPALGEAGPTGDARCIGQPFVDPGYLWGRASATSVPYDASASAASNLGPTNPALLARVRVQVAALRAAQPPGVDAGPVPVELVTTSGSGLDPNVSPSAARWQVPRIARARALADAEVQAIVDAHVVPRLFGVFGEPVVDVLGVNRALDARAGRAR